MLRTARIGFFASLLVTMLQTSCSTVGYGTQEQRPTRDSGYREAPGVHRFTPSLALGEFNLDINGGGENDEGASMFRAAYVYDTGTLGAGARVSVIGTFDDFSIQNGRGQAVRDVDVGSLRIFGHGSILFQTGPVELPLRIGPVVEFIREHGEIATNVDSRVGHALVGVLADFTPAIRFELPDDAEIAIFAGGQIGYQLAFVDVDIEGAGGIDDSEDSSAVSFGFEAGIRFAVADGKFGGAVSYIYRDVDVDDFELDNPALGTFPGRQYEFDGVMISASFRF